MHMNLRDFPTHVERNQALEKELKTDLASIREVLPDAENTVTCENLVGAVSLPLGVAGPIAIHASKADRDYILPLATTEGALVASVSRGCKAINAGGGANALAYETGTSRGPVFYTGSLNQSNKVYRWIKENEQKIAQIAESTSSHLKFKKVFAKSLPNYVFTRFQYTTDEAMGMNMVTIATEKVAEAIVGATGVECITVAGNFDIDKKPAWMNSILCRGKEAWAEAIIPKETVENVLKTTSEKIFDVWLAKCMLGSAMSGSLGFNCHFANIVAAMFIATGQDAAHVVEGSQGITTTKIVNNGDLYISVYLPALMVGTVGGGTKLKTQAEAKSILGVTSSIELAEVIAAAVLAGELSLLASLAAQSLASAHSALGRK